MQTGPRHRRRRRHPQGSGTSTASTLLIVQPLAADGKDVGPPAGRRRLRRRRRRRDVFFVRGKEACFPFHPTEVPADAGIVGIVDHWTIG